MHILDPLKYILLPLILPSLMAQSADFNLNPETFKIEYLETLEDGSYRSIPLEEAKRLYRVDFSERYGDHALHCLDAIEGDVFYLELFTACHYLQNIDVADVNQEIPLTVEHCENIENLDQSQSRRVRLSRRDRLPRDRQYERMLHCMEVSGVGDIVSGRRIANSTHIEFPVSESDLAKEVETLFSEKKYNAIFLKIKDQGIQPSKILTSQLIEVLPNKEAENLLNYIFYRNEYKDSTAYILPNENRESYIRRKANLEYDTCLKREAHADFNLERIYAPNLDESILRAIYRNNSPYAQNLRTRFERELSDKENDMNSAFLEYKKVSDRLDGLQKELNNAGSIENFILCKMMINESKGYNGYEQFWPKELNLTACRHSVEQYDSKANEISELLAKQKELHEIYSNKREKYFDLLEIKGDVSGLPSKEDIKKEIKTQFENVLKVLIPQDDLQNLLNKEIDQFNTEKLKELLKFVRETEKELINSTQKNRIDVDKRRIEAIGKYGNEINSTPIARIQLSQRKEEESLFGDFGRWFEKNITRKIKNEFNRVKNRIKEDGVFKELERWFIQPFNKTYKEIIRIPDNLFCPRDNGGIGGYCLEGGLKCTKYSNRTECEYMNSSGETSGPAREEEQQNWDAKLAWLRQGEMQDMLNNMQGQLASDLYGAMFPSPALATSFKSILSADLQAINELTENGTKIPTDPVLKEQVLKKMSDLKALKDFLKGFGTGAVNSVKDLKDSITGLLGSISNFDTQEAKDFMVSMANMIYQTDFKSLISNAPDIASRYYNDFLQASPERKGEVIGYASSELLSMFLGAGLGKGALKALQGAGKLTKSGEFVNGLFSSASKLRLKTKEQVSKFANFTNKLMKSETGAVGSINDAINEGTRIIRGMEVVPRRTIGQHTFQRMSERGITESMVDKALQKGKRYWDPKNKTVNYVLEEGFASGKTLLVGQNMVTGKVTTVIRGPTKKLIRPRHIEIPNV